MEEKVRDAEAESLERDVATIVVDGYIGFLREDVKTLRRAIARPEPDFRQACRSVIVMMDTLHRVYGLVNDLRCMYDEE